MRLDSIAGPPSNRAVMQTAINAVAVVTLSAYPDPKCQIRKVWKIEASPQIANVAKKIHDK